MLHLIFLFLYLQRCCIYEKGIDNTHDGCSGIIWTSRFTG
jgi:hypothetical protein